MDPALVETVAAVLAVVVPILVAYLKKTMTSKGVSETQADVILDYVEATLDEMRTAKPDDVKLVKFSKTFNKLRKMWDKPKVTTEEMEDFLEELDE
jgi:hypothetical protein